MPAETLKNIVLVDLDYRLAFVENGVHYDSERVHVGGRVTADGQDVFRGQVLRVGEAERRKVGLPLFTCVLQLNSRENRDGNVNVEENKKMPDEISDQYYLSVRRVS